MYGVGLNLFRLPILPVLVRVCQCSTTRPLLSQNGYSASGRSLLSTNGSGMSLALPSGCWNLPSVYRRAVPVASPSAHGHWMPHCFSMFSYVMPEQSSTRPLDSSRSS